ETTPAPTDGFGWIKATFCCCNTCGIIYTCLYLIWIAAIWLHLTHGMWSAIQTVGWSGKVWFKRWKLIGNIYVTCVMLMFVAVILGFATGLAPSLH
ncbi:MAG: succinate dehydrogenase/fumarate reductase cytochrome b subunit, partial [Bacteroidales bacterium]|nr:succinate dehydrogenase/fumarate reductase cytochrome b subunit [Bacteroidales bacterium]